MKKKEISVQVIKIEDQLAKAKTLIEQGFEKLVKRPEALRAIASAVVSFGDMDVQNDQQSLVAGEFFYRILSLPLDHQKELVWKLADEMKIPRPVYEREGPGRPTEGRTQLAAVVYGHHPELLIAPKGGDSRAGKRITDHKRRYEIAAGLRKTRGKASGPNAEGLQPRAMRSVFLALWNVARTESEHRTLVSLFLRLVPEDQRDTLAQQMDKWTGHALLTLAAAPLGALTVEAREPEQNH